jgi:hypothetical protein
MEHLIQIPDWKWGTDKDAASWLGWEVGEFRKVVTHIGMRPGMKQSRQVYYWHSLQIGLLSELVPYLDLESDGTEKKHADYRDVVEAVKALLPWLLERARKPPG